MQKRVIDKQEFFKAVKISTAISIFLLIFFTIISIVTTQWAFLITAIGCILISNLLTLIPFYNSYKKEVKH